MATYALWDAVPEIHPTAFIHPDATVIGSVRIGAESSVWPQAVLRGDRGMITIGDRTSIQDGSVIHTTPSTPTIVGSNCVVGHLVHFEACTIEDWVLIGSNAVVLNRAVIRTRSLVGASALVPIGMEIPSGALALGIPATVRLGAVKLENIEVSVASYVALAKLCREGLRRLD